MSDVNIGGGFILRDCLRATEIINILQRLVEKHGDLAVMYATDIECSRSVHSITKDDNGLWFFLD